MRKKKNIVRRSGTSGRNMRQRRGAEYRSLHEVLCASQRQGTGSELDPPYLLPAVPRGVAARAVLFPKGDPGKIVTAEAIPNHQGQLPIQGAYKPLLPVWCNLHACNKTSRASGEWPPQIHVVPIKTRRVRPYKFSITFQEFAPFISRRISPASCPRQID